MIEIDNHHLLPSEWQVTPATMMLKLAKSDEEQDSLKDSNHNLLLRKIKMLPSQWQNVVTSL